MQGNLNVGSKRKTFFTHNLTICNIGNPFEMAFYLNSFNFLIEPQHRISKNVVCATSNASDQPAHTRSLIRAFASHMNIL